MSVDDYKFGSVLSSEAIAMLWNTIYPRSNFYNIDSVRQRTFTDNVREWEKKLVEKHNG